MSKSHKQAERRNTMAYYTIQTQDGYSGKYATKIDAQHARRVMFGNRALAHAIVRVVKSA